MKKLLAILFILLMLPSLCLAESESLFHEYQLNDAYTLTYIVDRSLSRILGQEVAEIEYLRCSVPYSKDSWKELVADMNLVIPEEIDGYPVVSLWRNLIDNSMLPGHIVSITLPDSLVYIHDFALSNSNYLTEIIVSPDHPYFMVVDGALFSKPDKKLICYPAARAGESYTIPKGTLSIAPGAFNSCTNLTEIIIPDSVTTIGEYAFSGCTALTSLVIPDSVTSIGDDAFQECRSLTSLTIGSGVTTLPANEPTISLYYEYNLKNVENSFLFSTALQEINVSPDNPAFASMDGVLFDKSLTTLLCYPFARDAAHYDIPQSVTAIAPDAFSLCQASISLPDNIVFTEGESREVYLYPIAISDERMQEILGAVKTSTSRKLTSEYKEIDPANSSRISDYEALEAAYPALKDGVVLWIERNAYQGKTASDNAQIKLHNYFAEAGYTAEDLLLDDANLASGPRSVYPNTIVCEQLTADAFSNGCKLLVERDSLAHHWALQNNVKVVFAEE